MVLGGKECSPCKHIVLLLLLLHCCLQTRKYGQQSLSVAFVFITVMNAAAVRLSNIWSATGTNVVNK